MANTDNGRLKYVREQAGMQFGSIIAGRFPDRTALTDHDKASIGKLVDAAYTAAEGLAEEFEKRYPEILNDNGWAGTPPP